MALGDVAEAAAVLRLVEARAEAPHAVVKAVAEIGGIAVFHGVIRGGAAHRHRAAAGRTDGEAGPEAEGRAGGGRGPGVGAGVEDELGGDAVGLEVVDLGAGGEDGVARDFPIGFQSGGHAREDARRIEQPEGLQIGSRRGGAGAGGVGVVGFVGVMELRVALAGGASHDEAEARRERQRVVKISAGADLVDILVGGVRRLAEGDVLAVGREKDVVAELGAFALEGAFADHVDGAGERVRGIGGRGHLGDFDAGNVVDRNLIEGERARVAEAVGRAGHRRAVGGDADHIGGEAANRDAGDGGRILVVILGNHAGHELQELADVTILHVPEGIGGEDVFQIGRVALLIDRDGGRIGLALGGDGEGVEFDDAALAVAGGAREIEILHGRLARNEVERRGLGVEARVGDLEHNFARGHLRQAVGAGLVGEDLKVGAAHGDAGVIEKLAGDDILHAAGNRSEGVRGGRGAVGGVGRVRGRECEGEPAAQDGDQVLGLHGAREFLGRRRGRRWSRFGVGRAEDAQRAGLRIGEEAERGVGHHAFEGGVARGGEEKGLRRGERTVRARRTRT